MTDHPNSPDFDAAVQATVARIGFLDDCQAIIANGGAAFEDWKDAVQVINAVGASNDEFLMDVIAADKGNAHLLLHDLANEPETARRLVNMPTRQRVGELAKMAVRLEAKAPRGVKADAATGLPAPLVSDASSSSVRVEPAAAASIFDPYDDSRSEDDFSAWFDTKYGLRR